VFQNRRARTASILACAGALAILAACGSDSTPTSPTGSVSSTTTTTTQPAAALVVQGSTLIPARQVFFVDVTTTKAGRIDVTIDYPAGNSVPMWLTDRPCSFQMFDRDACEFLVKSVEGTNQKTMSAASVQPGTYTLFVANDGPADGSVSYTVTLTPSAAAGALTLVPGSTRPRP
jgi:hypothetical protein